MFGSIWPISTQNSGTNSKIPSVNNQNKCLTKFEMWKEKGRRGWEAVQLILGEGVADG